MISDFELLAEKVGELAALAQALRRENADLRAHAVTLGAENGELRRRLQTVQERVVAVLARLPAQEGPDAHDAPEDATAGAAAAGSTAPQQELA